MRNFAGPKAVLQRLMFAMQDQQMQGATGIDNVQADAIAAAMEAMDLATTQSAQLAAPPWMVAGLQERYDSLKAAAQAFVDAPADSDALAALQLELARTT